jgi:RNA polymerase sigma-70 factor (sigma-E family)
MRLRGAEADEFTAFVHSRRSHLVFMAQALLSQHADEAEDVVQLALVRLASRWNSVRDPNAYVRRAIVNLTVDRGRKQSSRAADAIPIGVSGSLEPHAAKVADPSLAIVRALSLRAALAQLPQRQRQVLVLRFLEDCNEAETARLLDCSVGTVKNTAHKGLLHLRQLTGAVEAPGHDGMRDDDIRLG